MATYKGIYYADGSTGMSNSQISYDEAVSYGDAAESVGANVPLYVNSESERDDLYPAPDDGTSVWRTDLGLEQRYSSSVSPTGWYTATTGMMLIRPDDFVFGGTTSGSSGTVTSSGVVTFTKKSSIYLNGIFSPAFRHYKILFNLKTTGAGTDVLFQFTNDGTPDASSLYSSSSYYSNASGTLTAVQQTTLTYGSLIGSSTTARNGMSELTLFAPSGSYPGWKASGMGMVTGAGAAPWVWNNMGFYNSTTVAFDGIVIYGSQDLTGSIMVYGFN